MHVGVAVRRSRNLGVALAVAAGALAVQPVGAAPSYAGIGCGTPLAVGDCTAPTATITSQPAAATESTAASFEFTTAAPESGATFACRLEKASVLVQDWTDCTTPAAPMATTSSGSKVYTGLSLGTYTFQVRATDSFVSGNNVQEPPTTYSWTVNAPQAPPDEEDPETTITSAGKRWHLFPFIGVEYGSDEPAVGFVCTFDGTERSCDADEQDGQTVIYGLRPGDHTFTVAAVDTAGNVDETPAVHRWTVPFDDRSLKHSRGWQAVNASGYYQDGYARTRQRGAYLRKQEDGFRSAVLVVTTCAGCGTVTAYLGDRELRTIRLAATPGQRQRVVELGSWVRPQTGVVKVVVSSANKDVKIDALGFSARR